jgi:hypothetical protein
MHVMHTYTHTWIHTYIHTHQFIGSFETYQECSDACYAQRLGANKACAGFGRAGGALVDRVSGASCKLVCVCLFACVCVFVYKCVCMCVCMCVCVLGVQEGH